MRFRINEPHVLHQMIDGEVVIIHLDTGNYYSLLKSGADVWSAVAGGAGMRGICAALARKYRTNEENFADAVAGFVARLQSEGLIEALDDAGAAEDLSPREEESPAAPPPFEPPLLEKYEDMQDLILLDPVHEVDDEKGWPHAKRPGNRAPKS